MISVNMFCPRRNEVGQAVNAGPDHWRTEVVVGERYCSFGEFRTCSYCGSIHPSDVLAMLKAGWRAERSDKAYKGYMHAPVADKQPTGVGAMKFYVMHFSAEQLLELNRQAS